MRRRGTSRVSGLNAAIEVVPELVAADLGGTGPSSRPARRIAYPVRRPARGCGTAAL